MVVLRGCLDGLPDQLACLLSLKSSPYRKSHCFCLLFEEDYCDDEQQTEAATLQNAVAYLYCNTPRSVDPMGSTLVPVVCVDVYATLKREGSTASSSSLGRQASISNRPYLNVRPLGTRPGTLPYHTQL